MMLMTNSSNYVNEVFLNNWIESLSEGYLTVVDI